jgi:hypothetical protein
MNYKGFASKAGPFRFPQRTGLSPQEYSRTQHSTGPREINSYLVVPKYHQIMNYKVRSLIYLFAFILSALLYYQVENGEDPKTLPDLTLEQSNEAPETQDPVL